MANFLDETGLALLVNELKTNLDDFKGTQGLVYTYNNINYTANVGYNNSTVLTEIIIPKKVKYNGNTYTVTSIGSSAFANCSGLTSITIPNGVTSIGGAAFANCSGLTSITIPNGVTSIGEAAFANCSGLTSVTIPDSVTSIGEWAFFNCNGLTTITMKSSTPPALSTEVFPDNVTDIYVPYASVSAYKSAVNWSVYADKISADPYSFDTKVDKTTTVNGHALSADVTVSKSDVGLGNAINPGSAYGGTLTDNWNTITLCGDYTSYTGATGLSAEMNALGVSWHGYHINSNVGTGGAYQRLIAFVNTDIVCYERTKVAGTWGSWINTTLSKKAGLADNNTFTGTMTVLPPTANMHAATKQYVDNSSTSTAAVLLKTITLTEDVSSLDVLDSSDNVTANKFLIEIRIPREDTPQAGNLTVRTDANLTLNTGLTNVLYSAAGDYTIQKYIDIEYDDILAKSIVYGNSSSGNIDNDSKDTPRFAGVRFEVSKYNQVKTINISSTNFIFRTGTRIYVVKKES